MKCATFIIKELTSSKGLPFYKTEDKCFQEESQRNQKRWSLPTKDTKVKLWSKVEDSREWKNSWNSFISLNNSIRDFPLRNRIFFLIYHLLESRLMKPCGNRNLSFSLSKMLLIRGELMRGWRNWRVLCMKKGLDTDLSCCTRTIKTQLTNQNITMKYLLN